jgi:hypothetical protein
MKLTHLLNKEVIIARMATVSGDRLAFSTVTAEMMHIQPMSDSKSQLTEGVFGKVFRIYTDGNVDVQDGDRLKDEDGNYYTVRNDGVSRRTFGSFDYLIIAVEKTK